MGSTWRVYRFPTASSQAFNVCGVILRGGRTVVDHDEQGPGPPQDDLVKALLQIVQDQARAIQDSHKLTREVMEIVSARTRLAPSETPPDTPTRRYRPQNKDYRQWATFRSKMQQLERIVRRVNQLGPDDEVAREMIYAQGGPHPRTLARIMLETHGLALDCWPPSTWPQDKPGRTETAG